MIDKVSKVCYDMSCVPERTQESHKNQRDRRKQTWFAIQNFYKNFLTTETESDKI